MLPRTFLAVAATVLVSCGSTERFLRPEPAIHMNAGSQLPLVLPDEIKDTVKVRCVGSRKVSYSDGDAGKAQCMYLSADVTNVMQKLPAYKTKDNRDLLLTLLVSISDQNCATFLARAFANKTGITASRNILSDLATSAAAGTAAGHPAISAGLSVSSLLAGKASENLDRTYYAGQTFQAMEPLILGERDRAKAQILRNMAKDASVYSVIDGISEVRRYDEACSIQRGLLKLSDVAERERTAGETALTGALAAQ